MDDELKQYLGAMETRINERIEKTETKLLTVFHRWSRSMEIRVRNNSSSVAGFDERLALAEERIGELERRSDGSGKQGDAA
jgi:hypothetical protein